VDSPDIAFDAVVLEAVVVRGERDALLLLSIAPVPVPIAMVVDSAAPLEALIRRRSLLEVAIVVVESVGEEVGGFKAG
jgi:hypothetical protein